MPEWLEIAKLLASVLTPITVAVIGYFVHREFKRAEVDREKDRDQQQRKNDELRELEKLEREARREDLERRHTPHVELLLDCSFVGRRDDQVLTTITVLANNKGNILQSLKRIKLRVRGIKREPFALLEDNSWRASFPHKVLETNLVPENWNFIFIEPGITQRISLNTIISSEYRYLLIHVEFEYKKHWPHTAEAMFVVSPPTEIELVDNATKRR